MLEKFNIFLGNFFDFVVMLLLEVIILLDLPQDLLLDSVELLIKGLYSALKENLLGLGLLVCIKDAFKGFFKLDFGFFEVLVLVFVAFKCDFEVLLDFGVGSVFNSGLVDEYLLPKIFVDLGYFFVF